MMLIAFLQHIKQMEFAILRADQEYPKFKLKNF